MYYFGVALQRISLLLAAMSTVILWTNLIAITYGYNFVGSLKDVSFTSLPELNTANQIVISNLKNSSIIISILALICSLLLIKLPQINKYRKHMVFDGALIAGFLLVVSVMCEPVWNYVINNIMLR